MADHLQEAAVDWPVFLSLIDNQNAHEVMHAMSPLLHVQKGVAYPPFLLIHGDEDTIVAYKDSVSMYHALCDAGVWARLIRVIGAPHEGNFWSPRLHGLIAEYLGEKLQYTNKANTLTDEARVFFVSAEAYAVLQ